MMKECPVIIGMACRVPGATNPTKLWENIVAQKDLQRPMPKERFNIDAFYHPDENNKGTINTKYGYFLDQPLGLFDAEFFGISGREAEAMDPQQRMLLETVYEALENAGITLDQIRGTRTSVYCGAFTTANDYHALQGKDLEYYPKYAISGTGNAILSNRISYFYNLNGPSMTIDTGCSSSLVCFHLGSQSLLDREADISLVVGSALHFAPNTYQTMSDMGFMSSDGRCRSFDASGSGYVRGDGICAVVLKRYSDALEGRDRVRAVVRATAVNHDGKTDGITLPSSEAQEALIRSTYLKAGLHPDGTQYFEAHGTGTKAGDPREARAIGSVFGTPTRREPMYVGSVKSNIGHLEGAAGLAGIIKTTLAIEKGKIPPNMLFENPNPDIPFEEWKIAVPTTEINWNNPSNGPRRASINSFGYGGANAHVILESGGMPPFQKTTVNGFRVPQGQVESRPYLLPITSHSQDAGKLTMSSLRDYVRERTDLIVEDLAYSLRFKRSMHKFRSFVIGCNQRAVLKELEAPRPTAAWTNATDTPLRIGFVFTGQGAQSFDMGRQLIQQSPIFKATLEQCDAILQTLSDGPSWSIIGELLRSENDSRLSQSKLSQPICTALQLALVILLKEWGIHPAAVCGHSSGEIAAAYAAGILSFEAAIVAAYYRGLHMSQGVGHSTPGSMMAVGLTESEARAELEGYKGRLTIAAVNSLSSITVSGDKDAILELKEVLLSRKVFARQLKVEQAFHSHHMRPLAPGYDRALATCSHFGTQDATCRMFSSVTARVVEPSMMNTSYWAENMVQPVRFSDALTGILLDEDENQNVDILVEIGPHPALKGPSREVASSLKISIPYIASLTRGEPAFDSLLETAGQLFAVGYPVNLEAVNRDHKLANGEVGHELHGKILEDLPSYSWNRKNYWSATRLVKEYLHRPWRHTVLGSPVPGSIGNMPRWRNYLRLSEIPWLRDHMVDGKVVFPAAGYICMAIEAGIRLKTERLSISVIRLKEVFITAPLTLRDDTDRGSETLIELRPVTDSARTVSDDWYEFSVSSYDEANQCTEHCRGCISIEYGVPQGLDPLKRYPSIEDLMEKSDRRLSALALYSRLDSIGLHYGERFALLKEDISSGPGFSVTPLTFDPNVFSPHEVAEQTILHPTMLDAAFHVIFSAIETLLGRDITDAFVSTFMGSLDISGLLAEPTGKSDERKYTIQTHTQLPSQRTALNDILLHQQDGGQLVMEAQGVEVTALGTDSAKSKGRALFFRQRWQPCFDLQTPESSLPLHLQDLEAILDLYTFQHPSSRILHISYQPEDTRKLLRHLIPISTGRPLFHSMHVSTSISQYASEFQGLEKDSGGLVKVGNPEGMYDLVIFDKKTKGTLLFDPLKFMNQSSILVSNAAPSDQASFETIIPPVTWGAFRQKQPEPGRIDLTVILPSPRMSKPTEDIFHQIRASKTVGQVLSLDFEALSQHETLTQAIVVLASLDGDIETPEIWAGVRRLLTLENKTIVWVLEGATMECSNPDHAKIIGLLRTARNENQQSRFVSLDVGKPSSAALTSKRILQSLDDGLAEEELTDRNGCVYIPRIEEDVSLNRKLPNGVGSEPQLERFGDRPALSLRIGKVGLLETLHFAEDEEITNEPLGENELEIKVMASALNFHDIAAAMGIIQDYKLGNECAGVVVRIGSNVDKSAFNIGDRVVAWRPGQGAHATLVRQPAMMCVKIPESMSVSVASSLSIVLTTAYYALIDVGRLQPGETVLIHSAAGGVGQIAIQIAQRIGARILATCSEPKRELLRRRFGLDDSQIFSSRDDSFVRGVFKATDGKGVDVALNSLAGKLLQATWSCMNNLGRFIEIGKRDIHQNSNLAMDPFRKNVTFASVDLIVIYEMNRPLGKKLLDASFELFFKGDIVPPEGLLEFPYGQAEKAFRMLQLGKHTGKVVLIPDDDNMVLVAPPSYQETPLFSSTKTYLLVGGLGGLGTAVAEWMYRRGARIFAFLSRSGDQHPYAKKTVDWLRSKNAKVSVYQGDVAVSSDVNKVVADIGPSLGGLFHAAVVLQDAMIRSMTLKQLQICLRTKCGGARNLHNATIALNLDFFVCFSSVSAMCGNKGQAAYVAANAYLDAMMRSRREKGLVGTAMTVGAVPSRGLVAENLHIRQSLERNKLDILTEQELMYLVEEAVTLDCPESDPRGVDWHQIIVGVNVKQPDVWWAERSLFRNLYANREYGHSSSAGKVAKKLAVLLATVPDVESKTTILLKAFIEKVASVLGTPIESITSSNPLSFYGLDSIVAVEFRKWFKETADVDLSLFDVLSAKSIHSLVAKVVTLMPLISINSHEGQEDSNQFKGSQGPSEFRSDTTTTVSHIPKTNVSGPIPMSTFQLGWFFLHFFSEEKWRLNLSGVFHLRGRPSAEALRQSHRELVLRHPVLNTAFCNEGDVLEQKFLPDTNFHLTFHDLSQASSPQDELETFISRRKHQELNIEKGEVGTYALVKMSDDEHILIVILHHICFDRGSLFIFMDTWVDLYNAISTGRDIEIIPFPRITYTDFVLWHNERLKSDRMLPHLTFWNEYLNGVPETSKLLPFAKMERPSAFMPDRGLHRLQLSSNLFKRMRRICSHLNATPFHFLLAAFRAFLFRYTEERDVVLLMVDGNRPHVDVEELVGCFVNLIPVRFQEDCAKMIFEDLVRTATTTTLQALSHSELPFDEIVNLLNLPKRLGQTPIGQISVNYQMHGALPTYRTQDFEVTTKNLGNIPTPCEIGLEAVEGADGDLNLDLEYSTALYSADDTYRFLENFLVFLTSSIQDHRQSIAEINMCGPKELEHLQERYWNTEFIEDPWADSTILQKIQSIAESFPHAEAIRTSSGNTISYSQLLQRASALASAIKPIGHGSSSAMGVFAQPGIECVIGMLATLIASSCYVPLDSSSANDRLSFIIRDANIKVLLVTEGLETRARGIISKSRTQTQVISIRAASQRQNSLPIPNTCEHEQPFYMIYTSASSLYIPPRNPFLELTPSQGSTGYSKGVTLTHGATRQMLSCLHRDYKFSPDDRFLLATSISFDPSVVQIFSPLTCGATMCIAEPDTRKDPIALADFILKEAITFTYFTPTQLSLLLEFAGDTLRQCFCYRLAFMSGERLPARLVRAFYDLGLPTGMYNLYGLSETVVQNTSQEVAYPTTDETIPIGFGLDNSRLYIVDPALHPLPVGLPGELYIGGAMVGTGYQNLPSNTRDTFVPNPFCCEGDRSRGWTKMFRTGDQARFRPDGSLDFIGRISGDRQVKIRSHQVDLDEVENQLRSVPNFSQNFIDVVVLPRSLGGQQGELTTDDKKLVAFLVPKKSIPESANAVVPRMHEAAGRHLDEYMIPSGYQLLKSVPFLTNGKLDRGTLYSQDLQLIYPSSGLESPGAESRAQNGALSVEEQIIKIFQQVLNTDSPIKPDASFFDVGGNSILMVRMQSRLKKAFNTAPSLAQMFQFPTPKALTSVLQRLLSRV